MTVPAITGMTDTSGSSAWKFDERGRVISETKMITSTGGGTFVTQWAYDAADRVKTQTYPGGGAGQVGGRHAHPTIWFEPLP